MYELSAVGGGMVLALFREAVIVTLKFGDHIILLSRTADLPNCQEWAP